MVSVLSLWLPILVSAVAVFVASSVIHMLLTYHRSDYRQLPSEDRIMSQLREANIPPGDYLVPYAGSPEAMKDPEYVRKREEGPVAFMTVMESGAPAMGKQLGQWFVYCVVVGVFAAYIAGRALGPGAPYLDVFRFAGTTAFVGYALALWQEQIWFQRSASSTLKSTFDGLVYGLLTAGVFGWLWPG